MRFTEKQFIPYNESVAHYSGYREKIEVSGNPVRDIFNSADSARGRAFLDIKNDEPVILVLGGSSGAMEINNLVRESLPVLTDHFTVVHQTGNRDFSASREEVNYGARYKPYAYFHDEYPHIIAAADLVICRGGAGTLWEIAILKKPMIIIPLSSNTRGDQIENAELFEKAGAAFYFRDEINSKNFCALITALTADKERREAMVSADTLKTGAAEYIAEFIAEKVRK